MIGEDEEEQHLKRQIEHWRNRQIHIQNRISATLVRHSSISSQASGGHLRTSTFDRRSKSQAPTLLIPEPYSQLPASVYARISMLRYRAAVLNCGDSHTCP